MRLTAIDICKGIAIILMVIGHTEFGPLMKFIYEFHMPIFFIAAGYCFSEKYLDDGLTFVKKRFKGLYLPFLKWSVIFLCLHNLWFKIGLLNEQYGNFMGGVTHPYSLHTFEQRLWSCVFNMSGYDEFITGAYWFFRGLLVASIGFWVLFSLLRKVHMLRGDSLRITLAIGGIAYGLALWKCGQGLKVTGLAQGGYRDLMGLLFFAVGYAFRLRPQILQRLTWWKALLCFVLVFAASRFFPASMTFSANILRCLYLPLPAVAGFLMTYWVASHIAERPSVGQRFLVYCGQHTLCIYLFHTLVFKLVSALKIWYYGLDWGHIGDHMVVHYEKRDPFWILYTLVAVLLPLVWERQYDKLFPDGLFSFIKDKVKRAHLAD